MTKNVAILIFLQVSIQYCESTFLKPIEISEAEESFVLGETEYLMLNVRVTWNEAEIICESYRNGTLAIVDANDTRDFLGEALSETNLEMEDLWIGAKAQPGSREYTWINNAGTYTPDKYFIQRGKESFGSNISRDCLGFARQFHETAHFINLECNLRRPFICEKPYEKIYNGTMTTPDWIVIGKYKYGIFHDRKTWRQAVRECRRKYHAHLASFRNNDEVTIVGKFLLIGRPSLENAWIGGHYKNGDWRFIYDGLPLKEEPDPDTLYPPWRQDKIIKHAGCLLLDRHLANHPVFLEARCERRRSYVCTKETRHVPDYSVLIINNTGYIIYYLKKSWEDALQQCTEHDGAFLVKVTTENIHDITYIMGENVTEVNHIWIGGRLTKNGANFYWVVDNEPIPPNNIDQDHYPPWYDNEYDQNYACLNMDRENHNRPLFYGAACDTPQPFICEQPDIRKLPKMEAETKALAQNNSEKTIK